LPTLASSLHFLELRLLRLDAPSSVLWFRKFGICIFDLEVGIGGENGPRIHAEDVPLVDSSRRNGFFKLLLPLFHIIVVEGWSMVDRHPCLIHRSKRPPLSECAHQFHVCKVSGVLMGESVQCSLSGVSVKLHRA